MKKIKIFFKNYWLTLAIIITMILGYIYISENGMLSALMFPKISDIWKVIVEDFKLMPNNVMASMKLLLPAILLSLVVSLSFGMLMGLNKTLRVVLNPIAYALSCIPSILLSPVIMTIAPSSWWASVILIVYAILWGTLFSTITGIATIDKKYLDIARTLELNSFKKFFKVVLPAASPAILSGVVNSIRASFVMLVYAEMFGSELGLGYYIKKHSDLGVYPQVWSGFIFMIIILVIIMKIFELFKDKTLQWTE